MMKKLLGIFLSILLIVVPFISNAGIIEKNKSVIDECLISNWVEQAKLLASDGDSYDNFGSSVSIDGDHAIIGAWSDEENGVNSGSAYVFKRNNTSWDEEAKLVASDGGHGDLFGISVSIDGDYAIVGTWDNAAYIFKRDGTNWTQQAKLKGSDGNFGRSVSINGDYAIVGSHGENNFTGAAYIFKRDGTNWTQQAKMTGMEDSFGLCVSIDGDYALVGEDHGNDGKGAAYVYKRNGTNWIESAKLTASDAEKFSLFGGSVSIDGEYVIVGADCDGSTGAALYLQIQWYKLD